MVLNNSGEKGAHHSMGRDVISLISSTDGVLSSLTVESNDIQPLIMGDDL
jgi:hypothetical protein